MYTIKIWAVYSIALLTCFFRWFEITMGGSRNYGKVTSSVRLWEAHVFLICVLLTQFWWYRIVTGTCITRKHLGVSLHWGCMPMIKNWWCGWPHRNDRNVLNGGEWEDHGRPWGCNNDGRDIGQTGTVAEKLLRCHCPWDVDRLVIVGEMMVVTSCLGRVYPRHSPLYLALDD